MIGAVVQTSVRLRARYEAKSASHGLSYPWWIPLCSTMMGFAFTLTALAQRDALVPPAPIALVGLLAILPPIAHVSLNWWVPWWAEVTVVLAGVGWLLSDPLAVQGPADVAPVVLSVLAAEMTATEGALVGLLTSVAGVAALVVTAVAGTLPGFTIYCGAVVLGLDVGYMLRWQMRALAAERAKGDGERAQAALAERQRVAREVHDVVAHSLSVTMLHITGARHALDDDGDIADALEALADAERIGRQAMADIRRTVSVLATEPAARQPLPGIEDIADLVAGVRAAGLDIAYEQHGDLTTVAPGAGLGVYRIAQESLANVAKHAPTSPVQMRLEVRPRLICLTVRNRLLAQKTTMNSGGSGLPGMTARASQLGGSVRVGPAGADWTVQLSVPNIEPTTRAPIEDDSSGCAVRRLVP